MAELVTRTVDQSSCWWRGRLGSGHDRAGPPGYDHVATRARFDRLAALLDQLFHCTCTIDRAVQDASHHGTIVVPTTGTASGDHITIIVSNFGGIELAGRS